jgi:hypothetical protein
VSLAVVAEVVALGVDAVQHVHAGGQVGSASLHDEVVVRGHQAEGVAAPGEALDDVREEREKAKPVGVVPKDARAGDARRDDVKEPIRKRPAKETGHRPKLERHDQPSVHCGKAGTPSRHSTCPFETRPRV